jgi:hypothetical protein
VSERVITVSAGGRGRKGTGRRELRTKRVIVGGGDEKPS